MNVLPTVHLRSKTPGHSAASRPQGWTQQGQAEESPSFSERILTVCVGSSPRHTWLVTVHCPGDEEAPCWAVGTTLF